MHVLHARNVHSALPQAIELLSTVGVERPSRNGPVLQSPVPVSTVYQRPMEKVIFWPERDANPFLHIYESLWMLAGRNDVAPLIRYAKQFEHYSDDGITLYGAYGARWRRSFKIQRLFTDQLECIARKLREDKHDRRVVLQMWDCERDLERDGRDVPCNLIATFQIGTDNRLDLVVFCRSNDIVWGAYGANAVHFAFLLEYMAHWIRVEPGIYTQVSVNWHGYVNTMQPLLNLPKQHDLSLYATPTTPNNPYQRGEAVYWPFVSHNTPHTELDHRIYQILREADSGDFSQPIGSWTGGMLVLRDMLEAHTLHKCGDTQGALAVLERRPPQVDWIKAGREWLQRRLKNF